MKAINLFQKINSWEDFRKILSTLSKKEKGDFFELLTKYYLLFDPIYSTRLSKVWLLRDVPEPIRVSLALPETDQGIDLIAQTKTGEFWAIQCKYREEEEKSLTWREISTFSGLSFGVCKDISFGLICTNLDRFTNVLKNQDNVGFLTSEVWHGLDSNFFKKIGEALSNRQLKTTKRLQPRPHQRKAINAAVKHFLKNGESRGKLIMPCGTGKSLTAYWITNTLNCKTIIIAVPSLALIRQTLHVWLREVAAEKRKVDWVCVCSDESVGKIEQDDIAVLPQDLGIPCLTDMDEITKWLKAKNQCEIKIVFTTYQSGKVIADASRAAKIYYDFGIFDEAHKTVGQNHKLFSHLLFDKNIFIRRRLFMTATERRYNGKSDEVISMDNLEIYGKTFHLLTFKEALKSKPAILSDYKVLSIFVTKDEIRDYVAKNLFVHARNGEFSEEVEAEMLASLIVLRKAYLKYPIHHTVSFHSSIKRAAIFKENQEIFNTEFSHFGKLATFHVHGAMPTGKRERLIDEFAASKQSLITNARCLTEGVDVPSIDCVLFADPKQSTVDIVQAVGRALRPNKGKKFGYIIVPIILDETPPGLFEQH